MNVLTLIPENDRQAPPTWNGVLSMAIAQALPIMLKRPRDAHADLHGALEGYLRSGAASDELVAILRREMR